MELNKDQRRNALIRIKDALSKNDENKAMELVNQIFCAGYQKGIDAVFEGCSED